MRFPNGFISYIETYYKVCQLRFNDPEILWRLQAIEKEKGWRKVCEVLREITISFEQSYKREGEFEGSLIKFVMRELDRYVQP